MRRRMLIDSDPWESRIAVLEEEKLVEIFVERHGERGLVGNIYKGRVTRVLAGMQAAFVDIGLDRDAFLYVADAQPPVARFEVGSGEGDRSRPDPLPIQELVSEGQVVVVQVAKDPLPQKGARVTTQLALPARFLVLLPGVGKLAVSRRIEDADERQRLVDALGDLGGEDGLIVRTAGEGRSADEFAEDHRYLVETWADIEAKASQAEPPSLLHADLDPALRVVRDVVGDSFRDVTVQGGETFRRVATFFERVQPALADRVREHSGEEGLFASHGLEKQIDAALRSKVWLKSGGYLVISPTEALVAIDINTGRFVGGTNLEETVFKTNLEAAGEVARQIRLRDIGGIIVVDFIDMERPEHRQAVLDELMKELERDRARSRVLGLSDFGLVEITRKRSRANLSGVLTEPCPDCRGRGRVKTFATVSLAIRREMMSRVGEFADRDPLLVVHPQVQEALATTEGPVLRDIEQSLGKKIALRADPTLHREQFEVLSL